jgi:TolB-like protein/Tfp pilus assembly protein PilF
MATGKMAFGASTSALIFDGILHKTPTAPVRINPELPLALEDIINKALEKDVNLRYQNATDVVTDLKRLRRESSSGRIEVLEAAPKRNVTARTRWTKWLAGVAGVLVLLAAVWVGASFRGSHEEISSIAVLPFVNAAHDPNTDYLSDGITESLINSLSQLPNLSVMARSSVFRYRGRDIDPQTVAKDLKVQAVVMGRIILRGDELIVSSELIDARTSRNLWGDQYNRKMSDLIDVQRDITAAISGHLREHLGVSEHPAIASRGSTNDPDAYSLYLKGRYLWEQRTKDSVVRARDYFNQAIQQDPNYALAYVGLADCDFVITDYAPISINDTTPKVRAEAEKALEIDPNLAEAHNALAAADWNDWTWADAEREFRRAIELNPNLANAHHWYGLFLSWSGSRNQESISEIKRALQLDPLNLRFNTNLGQAYWNARQDDLALAQLKKTVELDPNFADVHGFLSYVYRTHGQYDLWLEESRKSAVLNNDGDIALLIGEVSKTYHQSGYRASIFKFIALDKQLSEHRYVDPGEIGGWYAAAGDDNAAFDWLNKAVDQKAESTQTFRVQRDLDHLRSDPRYAALLRRMGLPQ